MNPATFAGTAADPSYDLVIIGGTPAGIMAAVAAARMGKKSLLLERTGHIGGLPANGLGATDIATRGATGGLFLEFIQRIQQYYVKKYGADSQQVKDCSDGYHFEPSIAEQVFTEMLKEQPNVTVLTMRQFDAFPENLVIESGGIRQAKILNRTTNQVESYTGSFFLDATYEGDLIAAAGVPYVIGREGKSDFNEHGAGQLYKYWAGEEGPGTTYQGDNSIQSFNYRVCITENPANRVPIQKPKTYNRDEYVSFIEDTWTGNFTGVAIKKLTPAQREENKKRRQQGLPPIVTGTPEGILRITNIVKLPNGKTDGNNQHFAFLSTDLPEENWPWPASGWEWRDRFADRLRDYILGLFYFAQNDPEMPEWYRKSIANWGLAKDEYTDNNNFPRQVYVREGRRMKGQYWFTTHDAQPATPGARPPIHADSITASHYAIDSHAVRKRETGRIHLDGFLSYPTRPYTVPFGTIVPTKGTAGQIENLLAPVPVSGTHLGFSTLRMEPCWMALGHAAGVAASLCLSKKQKVSQLSRRLLQEELIKQKGILMYFSDVKPNHPQFEALQFFALRGFLPDWKAELDRPATATELADWKRRIDKTIPFAAKEGQTRGQVLQALYESARKLPDGALAGLNTK
ncbi:FAD-dependent oxidoreductase [Tellurirhabdus bombi]|uniref:FAD-dependent oxidoreductase n=1 Tax=Tellurirhabdus bombi TaxID=2907205 RepID=UPI001F2802D7|nr:FAD-dependent oxidoreductase [Tellurirhabdus bombi]